MIDDTTTKCARCHESREALVRERDEARSEAKWLRETADNELFDATDGAHPAWWRGHHDGCRGMERALQEARDEAARLQAIIDGRADPPSAAEVVAHGEAGGAWLVTQPARPPARMMPETRLASDPVEVWRLWRIGVSRWVPVLCGRPCAWPVVPTADKVTP